MSNYTSAGVNDVKLDLSAYITQGGASQRYEEAWAALNQQAHQIGSNFTIGDRTTKQSQLDVIYGELNIKPGDKALPELTNQLISDIGNVNFAIFYTSKNFMMPKTPQYGRCAQRP